jgi:aspartate carbamoyltransferase catalytic subunit
MSLQGKSFISSESLSGSDIESIFDRAQLFKEEFKRSGHIDHLIHGQAREQRIVGMVFSEPSTRTRLSFQMACYRLCMRPVSLDNMAVSSISKGETFADTVRNIAAMMPDLLVVRYGVDHETDAVIQNLPFPVINGGIGAQEHPTQALLDAYTIREFRGKVEGEKVLVVGDVLHSRVANSNLVLLKKMGAEIGYCSPDELAPNAERWQQTKKFSDLNEAMGWATVVMGLRIQKERHNQPGGIGLSIAEYRERYRIGGDQLKHFNPQGILLHPGPVIRGIEFSDHVLADSRCKVLDQVANGVFVRAALMSLILGFEVRK